MTEVVTAPPPRPPPRVLTVVFTVTGGGGGGDIGRAILVVKPPPPNVEVPLEEPKAQVGGHCGLCGQLVMVGPQILAPPKDAPTGGPEIIGPPLITLEPPIDPVIIGGPEITAGAIIGGAIIGGGAIPLTSTGGAPPVVTIRDLRVVMVPPAARRLWASG